MEEEYPRIVTANVLLLNDKIINWKTSSTGVEWKSVSDALMNNQPGIVIKAIKSSPDTLEAHCKEYVCNNKEEFNRVFEELDSEFYKQWSIHEHAIGFMPYGQNAK